MPGTQPPKWGVIYNADALNLNEMLHFSSLADDAGADSIWTAEGWRDAFVPLAAMAGVAKRVRVGTAIAQMARPPVLTALSALSMAEYSGGRFILGVGTAPRDWNKNWHGFDVPRPVARIREYVECIRTVWAASSTAPANYAGEYYKIHNYVPFLTPVATEAPIYLAGVNPRMIELAGACADGLILGPLNSVAYLKDTVHPSIKRGLDKGSRKTCELCLPRICAVSSDAAQARALARHAIAFYSLLPYYDIVLNPLAFAAPAQAIREAFARGDVPAMLDAVTDEMVAALAFAGTRDDIRNQAREFDGLIDTIILYSPYFGVGAEETRANHAQMLQIWGS
ncbi:MAG: LLM class flavin-dependent oxidoreductase [Alphaproteobacteria bacterium]|nr:LLM class flavin-dependent oxidoreductase [Alphaproteobacteria bacterium]